MTDLSLWINDEYVGKLLDFNYSSNIVQSETTRESHEEFTGRIVIEARVFDEFILARKDLAPIAVFNARVVDYTNCNDYKLEGVEQTQQSVQSFYRFIDFKAKKIHKSHVSSIDTLPMPVVEVVNIPTMWIAKPQYEYFIVRDKESKKIPNPELAADENSLSLSYDSDVDFWDLLYDLEIDGVLNRIDEICNTRLYPYNISLRIVKTMPDGKVYTMEYKDIIPLSESKDFGTSVRSVLYLACSDYTSWVAGSSST